ncbi:SPRY domain-containing protein [Thalassospira xiamenensis]|uniref:SPRY domain-containing protein n=1 Tax=Thalassospira xiamenensis TaxID=220697 RepID=A0A285TV61_9PROT|nr:SPRY domain-containing protein [Thalassospira xiamenensis]SOC28226.1 SPRY domain-containing protein [Thalassospira xiamenensis]
MSILFDNPPPAIGCGDPGDPIDFGVFMDGNAHFSRNFASGGNRRKCTFHFSEKLVKTSGGTDRVLFNSPQPTSGTNGLSIRIETDRIIIIVDDGSNYWVGKSASLLRDFAGWYSATVTIDTDQPDPENRFILDLDGVRKSLETTAGSIPAQGSNLYLVSGEYSVGRRPTAGFTSKFLGYLARFIYVDGIALPSAAFRYTSLFGHPVSKRYTGAFGANGFHLDFADPMDLGKDVSDNGNHFAPNGLTVDNQVTDTPTHSFNTNDPNNTQSTVTLSNGNLTGTYTGTANVGASVGTMPIRSGRFYWEVRVNTLGGHENDIGVVPWRSVMISGNPYSYTSGIVGSGEVVYCKDGGISRNGTYTSGYGASFATGDVIGVLVDCEQDTINFSKNGVWQGEIALCAKPFLTTNTNYSGSVMTSNFGQRAFVHPIPAGAKTLNTANMPCPELLKPDDYFTVRLSSGGADITDLPWNPLVHKTLVVSKRRDTAASWRVSDTARGNNLAWRCDVGGLEIASSLAFTANGIDVGADTEYQGSRVDYFWRASPKSGFDIIEVNHVTGTPTVVPHLAGGLIDYAWLVPLNGGDVRVFHRALPSGQYLRLNGGSVAGTDANWFASTAVNLTIGASLPTGRYSLPVWRTVPQFSAFVAYGGNSSVDGAFCPLDFLPRMALIKTSQAPNPHYALDIDRAPGNPITNELQPGTNGVENTITIDAVDFVSNGLKQRSSTSENNTTPNTIIPVAAWAQTPGKFARAR